MRRLLTSTLLCLSAASALGAVDARVDRNEIDVNESFTLTIETDDMEAPLPALEKLEQDFDVLGHSEAQSTRIVNGRIAQSRSWTLSLMPRRSGKLTIPSLSLGNETTLPLAITVNEPIDGGVGGEDVLVVAELDTERTWVQAQAIYTLRIYTAVSPRQPRLNPPAPEGVDVLFQQLGDDTRFESFIDGRSYSVVERRYALFPQASGSVTIPEVRYSARIWEGGRLSPRRVFRSNAVTLSVEPIPPPPANFPDAAWLPAKDIQLNDRWSPTSLETGPGEPVSRTIRITATGLSASQLPELSVDAAPGLKLYADQPELDTREVGGDVVGYRVERYAVIGAQPGDYPIQDHRLPWWSTVEGRWKVATLPGTTLSVVGQAAAAAAQPANAAGVEVIETPGVWRTLSMTLGAGWLATIGLWWWQSRPDRPTNDRADRAMPGRHYRRERRRLREADAALRNARLSEAAEHLLGWAELHWPDSPPRSLGEIAARVDGESANSIRQLSRALYGPADTTPAPQAIADGLKPLAGVGRTRAGERAEPLAPLTPG